MPTCFTRCPLAPRLHPPTAPTPHSRSGHARGERRTSRHGNAGTASQHGDQRDEDAFRRPPQVRKKLRRAWAPGEPPSDGRPQCSSSWETASPSRPAHSSAYTVTCVENRFRRQSRGPRVHYYLQAIESEPKTPTPRRSPRDLGGQDGGTPCAAVPSRAHPDTGAGYVRRATSVAPALTFSPKEALLVRASPRRQRRPDYAARKTFSTCPVTMFLAGPRTTAALTDRSGCQDASHGPLRGSG